MALRWGIASAGRISHDFVNALGTLPAGEHEVIAVGARSLADAQRFAQLHAIPNAYDSYEAIAANPQIEVVYIGALNPAHLRIGRLMLEAGKHLLCEKPLAMNAREARELTELARAKGLFLMEAIWSRFFPAYQHLRAQIRAGALGEVREVRVEFGFDHQGHDRVTRKALGAGVTLDQGVYVLQASLWAFERKAESVEVKGVLNEEGVDMQFEGTVRFEGGGVARIAADSTRVLGNQFVVVGTRGQITVDHFWSPTTLVDVDGTERTWPVPKARHAFNYPNSAGLRYEAQAVRKAIRAGRLEEETVSHRETLVIAGLQDEIRRQLGVHYAEHDL